MFNSLEEMLQALNMRLMATSYSSPNSDNGSNSGEKASWKYRYFAMVKRRILIDLAEIIEPGEFRCRSLKIIDFRTMGSFQYLFTCLP